MLEAGKVSQEDYSIRTLFLVSSLYIHRQPLSELCQWLRWLSDLWTKLVFATTFLEGGHLTWTSLPGSNFTKAEAFAKARPLLLLFIPLFVHLKWHLYMEPVWMLLI